MTSDELVRRQQADAGRDAFVAGRDQVINQVPSELLVTMLELQRAQLAEQQKASSEQSVVLRLQARELQESLDQRKREAEERLRNQASAVTSRLANVEHPVGGGTLLAAVISNQSGQPIYDVQAYLHFLDEGRPGSGWAATTGGASGVEKIVTPGSNMHVILPRSASPYPQEDEARAFAASIMFTDASGNRWERDPHGTLKQIPPDEAYLSNP